MNKRLTAPPDGAVEEKLPPHSDEAERGLIGCIIQNPDVAFDAIFEAKGDADWFFDLRNRTIFETARTLHGQKPKVTVDLATLTNELSIWDELESVGGISYLQECETLSPSAHNAPYFLGILQQKWQLRNIVQVCTSVIQKAYIANADTDSLVDEVERKILTIENSKIQAVLDGKQSGLEMVNDLDSRFDLKGKLSGLSTGFRLLDYMTEGLQPGEHTVIGARPSQGKTALGLTILSHSLWNGIPCLFVSLEMSIKALMRRMCAIKMKIPLKTIRKGDYTEGLMQKFMEFQAMLNKCPLHIHDAVDGCGIRDIASIVNRMVLKHGVKLVVVDYMQKIKPSERHEKRNYEVADVSGRLKAIAHNNNIHIITLAQLNRENVKTSKNEAGRPPRLSDLADSGQIERDADTVCLIHRDENETKLIVAKQRDGETGVVPLYFHKDYVEFCGMEEED